MRLVLAPFFMHEYDVTLFVTTARAYYSSWTINYFTEWAYPMFFYLILIISYFPADLISDNFYLFGQTVSVSEKFFVKLPFIISDLLIAYMLYRILSENGKEKYALFIALFYLLNPLSIFTSSVYGTFDSISILFSVLGFYHFLHSRYGLSGLELGMGFGIKFHHAVLIPVFLLFMWREAKREIPKFLVYFGGPAALSIVLPGLIYYDPLTHYWAFRFSTSNLAISFARDISQMMDPNMTYRALLLRWGFYEILFYSTLIEVTTFGGLFLLFVFLVWRKGLFEIYSQSRLEYFTAYIIAVYMILYLSYGRINMYYALWALPFLMIFFSFKNLNRFLLLAFNLIPFVQSFSRDSIFYYLNANYTYCVNLYNLAVQPYGVGWATMVASGFLFSLTCGLIFASLFRNAVNIYHLLNKIHQFFNEIPERVKIALLSLILITLFLLIVTSLNLNGLFWSGFPVTLYSPIDRDPTFWEKLFFGYFLIFAALPLSIFLSLSLHTGNLEPEKGRWRHWKLLLLLVSVSLLIILGVIILGVTLPYVAGGNGFFWGWMPI
ncbi:MAG: glycosyltransferase family 39 protein, partial [Candidatus Freyarchaeota archaeon]|nr:glycosyltransferase family 39 protein [Candidatus Jordarchaeia archaeon]